jgi:hypothetical protein
MQQVPRSLAVLATCVVLALPHVATAQTAPGTPPAITTPDNVESRTGTLEFKDGMPSKATLDKVYDHLDFTHAFEAFVNTFQGVNVAAIRKGFLDIGIKDNEVLVFSTLMDSKSLFLTANADTVYLAVYLHHADTSPRLTCRLSQGQKGLDKRALRTSPWPSHPS